MYAGCRASKINVFFQFYVYFCIEEGIIDYGTLFLFCIEHGIIDYGKDFQHRSNKFANRLYGVN